MMLTSRGFYRQTLTHNIFLYMAKDRLIPKFLTQKYLLVQSQLYFFTAKHFKLHTNTSLSVKVLHFS